MNINATRAWDMKDVSVFASHVKEDETVLFLMYADSWRYPEAYPQPLVRISKRCSDVSHRPFVEIEKLIGQPEVEMGSMMATHQMNIALSKGDPHTLIIKTPLGEWFSVKKSLNYSSLVPECLWKVVPPDKGTIPLYQHSSIIPVSGSVRAFG